MFHLFFLLLLGSCVKAERKPEGAPYQEGPFLGFIPDNSMFVLATLSPFDFATFNSAEDRGQLKASLEKIELALAGESQLRSLVSDVSALLDEHGTAEAMIKLGFKMRGNFALYAVGMSLVARLEVQNGQTFYQACKKIADKNAVMPATTELGDGTLWTFHIEKRATVWVAFKAHELVLAIVPTKAEEVLRAKILAGPAFQESLQSSGKLQEIAQKHGFPATYVGYFDGRALLGPTLGQADALTLETAEAWETDLTKPVSPACHEEILRLLKLGSRVVMGIPEMASDGYVVDFIVELSPEVRSYLRPLAGVIPAPPTPNPEALFELSAGVSFSALQSLLKVIGDNLKARPFQCKELVGLNGLAEKLVATQSGPAALWQLQGAYLQISALTLSPTGVPSNAEGFVHLASSAPGDLLDIAKLLEPAIKLDTVGATHVLPLPQVPAFLQPLTLVRTKQGVGLTLGEAGKQNLLASENISGEKRLLGFSMSVDALRKSAASIAQESDLAKYKNISLNVSLSDQGLVFRTTIKR